MSAFDTIGRLRERIAAGLERADEIGGELRHAIEERLRGSQKLQRVLGRVRRIRGRPDPTAAGPDPAPAPPAVAEPPATSAPAAQGPLGDPDVAAQIYGRTSSLWTGRAIDLLESEGVEFEYVDLDEDRPGRDQLVVQLTVETRQHTLPYVFLRGQFIGGFNALNEYARLGQLEYLLMSDEDKQRANPALQRVVITPRPNTDEIAPGETADRSR
jgi:glutaredoxin